MEGKKVISNSFKAGNGHEVNVSYCRIKGKTPGPVLTLIAGQHGMEHIGPVLLKEMLEEFHKLEFKGTLQVCPCANPLALQLDYEYYPENEDLSKIDSYYYSRFRHGFDVYDMGRNHSHNMNRVWGRKDLNSITARIAGWLWDEICLGSDVLLDFHALQGEKPIIFCPDNQEAVKLAAMFGTEAVLIEKNAKDEWGAGKLTHRVHSEIKIPCYVIELTPQHGYYKAKNDFEIGRRGILNVMKGLSMLDGEIENEKPVYLHRSGPANYFQLKTQRFGHIHYYFDQYAPVKKGETVFRISSVETLETLDVARSPISGIMGGRQPEPLSLPGRRVCIVHKVDSVVLPGEARKIQSL